MKQFKIGEYAIGGIISVDTTNEKVVIQALDWCTKEVVSSRTFMLKSGQCESEIKEYLEELTSSYYACKIMDFIKLRVRFVDDWIAMAY